MVDREDELARTATAPGSSAPATPAAPLGPTLGRYRLERELGQGGMGVVHAAFDPDLERRIALKVLRQTENDAQKRLLREARAMARLAHPNVITVHEVGSAAGRDYVAMELIHGETLADWLRAERRSEADILAAFVAAGRGLAAAHAAGIVHRDFKPHNVLRSREGRIVVTDFGLARDAEPDPLLTTQPARRASNPVVTESTPSALSGLTQTGSVLGTPAYMAPEQWSGGAVTPATDQFAYSVALWEALAGERPYTAATVEGLRAEVVRGPAALDASKLPRRLRRVLRRGLDPVPAKRWPSMDALLVAITRAERRPGLALAIGAGAFVLGTVIYLAVRPTIVPAEPCAPPPRELASVWSGQLAAELPAPLVAVFERDFAAWTSARATACKAPEAERAPQLHCLDSVLLRFDAVRQAASRVKGLVADDVDKLVVEPSVCIVPVPPRLSLGATPDLATAFELYARTLPDDAEPPEADVAAFLARPTLDPCARAIGDLAMEATAAEVPKKRTAITDALSASEQCTDDHLRAEALVRAVPYQFELPVVGPRGLAAFQRAEAAAKRIGDADLLAPVEVLRAMLASQQENWTEVFAACDRALAHYAKRQLVRSEIATIVEVNWFHFVRSTPEDIAAAHANVEKWLPIARAQHFGHLADQLARDEAQVKLMNGDVAGAHAANLAVWKPKPDRASPSRKLDGTVVDRDGHPVAGATVVVATRIVADSVGVPFPRLEAHGPDSHLRATTSDATGAFAFEDAPMAGAVLAQLGDRRSVPVPIGDHVKLALAKTRTLKGKVDLGATPSTKVIVTANLVDDIGGKYTILAPVAPDGHFEMAGAPAGKIEVAVEVPSSSHGAEIASTRLAPGGDVGDIVLTVATNGRPFDVIARSSSQVPLDYAQVLVLPGRVKLATIVDLIKHPNDRMQMRIGHAMIGEKAPQALLGKLRPGDLLVHFDAAPVGDLTACLIGLNGDFMDAAAIAKIQAHIDQVAIKCETVGGEAGVIEVEAPPQKRFD